MKYSLLQQKLRAVWEHLTALGLILAAVTLVCVLSTDRAGALQILTGAGDTAIVLDGKSKPEPPADFSSQMVYMGSKSGGFEFTIGSGLPVNVRFHDETAATTSRRETVSHLLDRLGFVPGPLDMVLVDVSGGETVELTVDSDLSYFERSTEFAEHKTIRRETADLPEGTEQVVREGSDGFRTAIYEVVYSNGEFISRQLVEEENSSVVDEEILVGTKKPESEAVQYGSASAEGRPVDIFTNADGSGVLTFASGEQLEFSAARSMTATAYTTGYDGVNLVTATGTIVGVGTVAVDKRVIPLGTRMFIVTNDGAYVYGLSVAADTGVRGEKVDLYFETYDQCIQFGRRAATVYILK